MDTIKNDDYEKFCYLLKYNDYDSININYLLKNNKNFLKVKFLNSTDNFLHYLLSNYTYNDDTFYFYLNELRNNNLLLKFFKLKNRKNKTPIEQAIRYRKARNIYLILTYIKENRLIDKFYISEIYFKMDVLSLLHIIEKGDYDRKTYNICEKELYGGRKLWNSFLLFV